MEVENQSFRDPYSGKICIILLGIKLLEFDECSTWSKHDSFSLPRSLNIG